jgi:adenylate cyclase
MHDSKTNELWSLVLQGDNINEIRFPSHLGIAGSVFTSRETVNIPDAYADPRFNQAVDKKTGYRTRNILCMPVINKNGTAIGVIQVLNKNGGPFTQLDENRLRAFSSQASIAIENAQLFEEVLRVKNYNESILKSLSNGVITLNWDGGVVKVNEAACAILMIQPEEAGALIGTPVSEMFSGPNAWLAESVATVVKSGEQHIVMDGEYLARGKDRISMNLTTVPLVDMNQQGVGTMLVMEDITKEKRLKGTMARYMTKEVAERLLEGGESLLGGQLHAATVLFSDIRGFTTISEKIGATRTVEMLNEYFTLMVDVLFKHNGVLDKYVGDAIMAVFGVPFTADDDADRAARASIEMLRTLREFNIHRAEVGDDIINIGIGLNTDDVLSGNIGSLKRMDYTVIGDGVNLASRLESANKYYGSNILLSEFTFARLKDSYICREVDNIKVKGKNKPVSVFQLLDFHTEESFPHVKDAVGIYTEGLQLYRSRNWAKAVRKFRESLELNPKDRLSNLYIERCRHFMKTPPGDDWDGVWIMTSK